MGDGAAEARRIPDYVCVGHFVLDVAGSGLTVGGTVAYAGRSACLLGASLGVVTAGNQAHKPQVLRVLDGADVEWIESGESTVYRNTYLPDGKRRQEVLALARALTAEDIPASWRSAPIVHVGPLTGEVPPDAVHTLGAASLVGVTPQGWMRHRTSSGLVERRQWEEYLTVLARADVVMFSEEDVASEAEALRYVRAAKLAVVTRGRRGADLFLDRRTVSVAAYPTNEVDPTGAGDAFAAAFLIEYRRTGSPVQACAFACAAGSFVVEGPFLGNMEGEEQIRRRMAGLPVPG